MDTKVETLKANIYHDTCEVNEAVWIVYYVFTMCSAVPEGLEEPNLVAGRH